MIFRFLILSNEIDNFAREIKIDSEATFMELHDAIVQSTGYSNDQMSSFFICDEDWSKKTEITLVDMGTSSEEDSYTMENTHLEDLLEDEGQKLLYVFDYMTERAFFIELRETIPGKDLKEAVCSRSEGEPPKQTINFDEIEAKNPAGDLLGEDFYGDSEYDPDELDREGFEGLDGGAGEGGNGNPFDDERF